MDMTLYTALQNLGRDNSHAKMVTFSTDWALNSYSSLEDWGLLGDAMDALGNIKLAQHTDLVEEVEAFERICSQSMSIAASLREDSLKRQAAARDAFVGGRDITARAESRGF